MPEVKFTTESHKIPDKRGVGRLRREVWIDDQGGLRYNLAHINHNLHAGDNGRWLAMTTPMAFTIGITLALFETHRLYQL